MMRGKHRNIRITARNPYLGYWWKPGLTPLILCFGGVNDDYGYGISTDDKNNIYIAGYTYSYGAGDSDIVLAKFNSKGELEWFKTMGGAFTDWGVTVKVGVERYIHSSGGYVYIPGEADGCFLCKFDGDGSLQWFKVVNYNYGYALILDNFDNSYIHGLSTYYGAGGYDAFTAKINKDGSLIWYKTIGGANNEYGRGIAIDSLGNLYITGYTNSYGAGEYDIYVAKLDNSFNLQWFKTLGTTGDDYGYGIALDSSGNIYVVGALSLFNVCFIAKLDNDGNLLWAKTISGVDYIYSVNVDSKDNIYITGWSDTYGSGLRDLIIAKLNVDGALQWFKTVGGANYEGGRYVHVGKNDWIYVTGYIDSYGAGNLDIILLRIPSTGEFTSKKYPELVKSYTPTVDDWSPTIGTYTPTIGTYTPPYMTPTIAPGTYTPTITNLNC